MEKSPLGAQNERVQSRLLIDRIVAPNRLKYKSARPIWRWPLGVSGK
jgi:hypothetical protein